MNLDYTKSIEKLAILLVLQNKNVNSYISIT